MENCQLPAKVPLVCGALLEEPLHAESTSIIVIVIVIAAASGKIHRPFPRTPSTRSGSGSLYVGRFARRSIASLMGLCMLFLVLEGGMAGVGQRFRAGLRCDI